MARKTKAEKLRLLQDELLRAEMSDDADAISDLRFRIEQAHIEMEIEKMRVESDDDQT